MSIAALLKVSIVKILDDPQSSKSANLLAFNFLMVIVQVKVAKI
jgi:hypothetical protein